jgi:hypothetical protein
MAMMVRVRTMDTASFKTLSPKTRMYKVLSTSSAWKMASVATGSTAEMSEPNTKLRLGCGFKMMSDGGRIGEMGATVA